MSLLEKAINNREQLIIEGDNIQQALYSCSSGRSIIDASLLVMDSIEMDNFFASISIEDIKYQEISLSILKDISQMMQGDPLNCIDNCINNLQGMLSQAQDTQDIEYYAEIIRTLEALGNSEEYRNYIQQYIYFQNDNSLEAQNARLVIAKKFDLINKILK